MLKSLIQKYIPERQRIEIRLFFRKIKGWLYAGSTYYCVCCEKHARKFLPHGNITRDNARCPFCGSLERNRLTWYYLENKTDIFNEGKKVLHFAPEKQLSNRFKKIDNDYISADINPALADLVVDITSIQFPDNYFDYVICSHVLGHVPDEEKAISEMYRVLKPGGRAIVLTLINSDLETTYEDESIISASERLIAYGEIDLVRLHGKDFVQRLNQSGIEVNRVDYRMEFSEMDRKKYSLGDGDREIIFDCKKLLND